MSDESLRLKLIDRVCKLPSECLAALDQWLSTVQVAPSSNNHLAPGAKSAAHYRQEFDWPHAPMHRLSPTGTYIVTVGTYLKEPYFNSVGKLDYLHNALLATAKTCEWQLEAWAVFSNHYHFVGRAPVTADALDSFARQLHQATAKWVNDQDNAPGRKVWHNYWETALTFEKSYFARLNYVHQNPVHHGLVRVANQYRWCSAAWFERTETVAQVKTIYGFKTDQLKVLDEFEVRPVVA